MDYESHMFSNRASVIGGVMVSPVAPGSIADFGAVPEGEPEALKSPVGAGYEHSVSRIQDWIRLPAFAAAQLNIGQGADYMLTVAADAGIGKPLKADTSEIPAGLDFPNAGAERTLF